MKCIWVFHKIEPDPLDYKFGESACCVFERWSKELKKMREKLK